MYIFTPIFQDDNRTSQIKAMRKYATKNAVGSVDYEHNRRQGTPAFYLSDIEDAVLIRVKHQGTIRNATSFIKRTSSLSANQFASADTAPIKCARSSISALA